MVSIYDKNVRFNAGKVVFLLLNCDISIYGNKILLNCDISIYKQNINDVGKLFLCLLLDLVLVWFKCMYYEFSKIL